MTHHHTFNTCPMCNKAESCRCIASKTKTKNLCDKCKEAKQSKISEDAVCGSTGAGAIAGVRGGLFSGIKKLSKRIPKVGEVSVTKYKNSSSKILKRSTGFTEGKVIKFSEFLAEEDGSGFDSVDVISKLSRNADIADELDGDDMAVFGMESEDGAITKVYIPREQAQDFERALGDALKNTKETHEQEIAGILYDLKDRFKIIDVKWPTVQEDEEQVSTASVPSNGASSGGLGDTPDGDLGADTAGDLGDSPDGKLGSADAGAGDTDLDSASDGLDGAADGLDGAADGLDGAADTKPDAAPDQNALITQILDMLRADAEARKAEAGAKVAAAHADEAKAAGDVAAIKLQGEEGVLDAEAFFKGKKEEKKEADRIKMLAKYRQETKMSQDTAQPANSGTTVVGDSSDSEEDEEQISMTRKQLLALLRKS